MRRNVAEIAASAALMLSLSGCDMLDMYDQPRYKPLAASDFFDDGMSARPQVEGTVARGQLHEDEALYTGKVDGRFADKLPLEVNLSLLRRGQDRFNIYCSPCHSRIGDGRGMIVERGFRRPPSYHIDRLRNAPAGYFFDVMTNGFGAMPSYANRIDVEDRWAIVSYIRALQLCQNATVEDVRPEDRDALNRSRAADDGEQATKDAAREDER